MKGTRLLFFIASLIIMTSPLIANIYPVDLSERMDSSLHVIVAEVIDKESHWDATADNIYTSYTMEVLYYAKNPENRYYFDLILPGGTVDDEVQINFPHIALEIGQEYLVTVEEVTFYQLNRQHLARSANPKFQPYSYIQGIMPIHLGQYLDYFEEEPKQEVEMLALLEELTAVQAQKPDGTIFEARTEFEQGEGDRDRDGVLNIYDIEPNNPNSDSDGDGTSDYDEKHPPDLIGPNGEAIAGIPSNPLDACDPNPEVGGCIGLDFDQDGKYSNYPPTHVDYDVNDTDACSPYAIGDCPLVDLDGDGKAANLTPTDPNHDPNDNNPCIPDNPLDIPFSADSWIKQSNPSTNYGGRNLMYLKGQTNKEQRVIVRFDKTPYPIPLGSVLSGSVHLYIDNPNNLTYNLTYYVITQEWEEEIVSWNQASATENWFTAGGEFASIISFNATVNQNGWVSFDLPYLILDSYLVNPFDGYSLLFTLSDGNMPRLAISSIESDNKPYLSLQLDPDYCELPLGRATENEAVTPTSIEPISLQNGDGASTNTFVGGTINEAHELIIKGNGFGSNGLISFPNADNGGANDILLTAPDLVYWTDTEIRVKVPKEAGSGMLKVTDPNGQLLGSADIVIDWALNPLYHDQKLFPKKTRQKIDFVNLNGVGGYTLELNTTSGFAENTAAVAAFERALQTWQCATGINWALDKTGTDKTAAGDEFCVIQFSDDLPAGVLGIATSRYKGSGSSSCSEHNTLWYLKGFDIEFATESSLPEGFSWNFSEGAPSAFEYDFESVALHELGHAHGLAHIIEEGHTMHYSITNGVQSRSLSEQEIGAAAHKMAHSLEEKCVSRFLPMLNHPNKESCGEDTATPTSNQASIKVFIEGFYDEAIGKMRTDLATEGLLPLAQPFNIAPINYAGNEVVETMPTNIVDWILLELRDSSNTDSIIHQQAALLRDDASIVNLNGIDEITFDGVPSANYYIALFHQNHLPIISSEPHPINPEGTICDFTLAATAALGTEQLKERTGKFMMYSGDFDGNGLINNTDYNLWKTNSSNLNIYSSADADGNGIINSLDYNLWKINLSKIGMLTR